MAHKNLNHVNRMAARKKAAAEVAESNRLEELRKKEQEAYIMDEGGDVANYLNSI